MMTIKETIKLRSVTTWAIASKSLSLWAQEVSVRPWSAWIIRLTKWWL